MLVSTTARRAATWHDDDSSSSKRRSLTADEAALIALSALSALSAPSPSEPRPPAWKPPTDFAADPERVAIACRLMSQHWASERQTQELAKVILREPPWCAWTWVGIYTGRQRPIARYQKLIQWMLGFPRHTAFEWTSFQYYAYTHFQVDLRDPGYWLPCPYQSVGTGVYLPSIKSLRSYPRTLFVRRSGTAASHPNPFGRPNYMCTIQLNAFFHDLTRALHILECECLDMAWTRRSHTAHRLAKPYIDEQLQTLLLVARRLSVPTDIVLYIMSFS